MKNNVRQSNAHHSDPSIHGVGHVEAIYGIFKYVSSCTKEGECYVTLRFNDECCLHLYFEVDQREKAEKFAESIRNIWGEPLPSAEQTSGGKDGI